MALQGEKGGSTPLPDLLVRMRDQDRVAVAEFIEQYGSLIRRRVRSKLSPSMRRVFDSLDVLSSLARRLDLVVARGQLRAMDEKQFMGFVNRVAENTIVDQARLMKRLRRAEDPDGDIVRMMRERLLVEPKVGGIRVDELARVIGSVSSQDDRDIVCMWMNGRSLTVIGETLGLSAGAVRQRWFHIRRGLRELFEESDQ